MPLVLKIDTPDGIVNINLFYSGKDLSVAEGETRAIITGAYDDETERAAVELGFEPSELMLIAMEWENSASDFLTSSKNAKLFLKALHEQGVESLGITMDELRRLFSWAAEAIIAGESNIEGDDLIEPENVGFFFKLLDAHLPEHRARNVDKKAKFDWPRKTIKECAVSAMSTLGSNTDVIDALNTFGEEVFRLDINDNCKKYDKDTMVSCTIDASFYAADILIDKWRIEVEARFTDAELLDWFIDETASSRDPEEGTREVLNHLGLLYDNDEIINTVEEISDGPETYQPDGFGNYAVFISGSLYGRYESEDEAIMFAEMSMATIKRENLPEEVHVYQRPEMYDDDDGDEPFFEEDEEGCWELIW